MNARIPAPGRFEAVMYRGAEPAETSREAYLASPIGKGRRALSRAHKCNRTLGSALDNVSCALTRGDGTEAARTALFDAVLELRIAAGDVEALVRIVEADA